MTDKRRFDSPRAAREQAAEAQGFLASIEINVGDETFEVPQRGLLDDEQAARINQLELETESWDRQPDIDIPEQRLKDKDGNETGEIIPAVHRQGPLKQPYRKNGELIEPGYPVRVAIALWGEEKYARYKKLGGQATDVTAALTYLDLRVEEREKTDPKSVASDSADT